MASLRSLLYKSARILGDVQPLLSGDRKRIQRRLKNKLVGKMAGIIGFWRCLWR